MVELDGVTELKLTVTILLREQYVFVVTFDLIIKINWIWMIFVKI